MIILETMLLTFRESGQDPRSHFSFFIHKHLRDLSLDLCSATATPVLLRDLCTPVRTLVSLKKAVTRKKRKR